jgi:RNA polymerase sigma-70 factor, ECF subfamily
VTTLSLCGLQTSPVPHQDHDKVAGARSLANRLARVIETRPTQSVTTVPRRERVPRNANVDNHDALVAAAVEGDREAISGVLRWIRPLVVRYCRTRVSGQEKVFASVEDVAQEVCLAVLTALPSYRDQGRPFLAFVYGIAAHKVADAHRTAARNRAEPVAELPDGSEPEDGPEEQLLRGELTEQVARLLDLLPSKQRDILILRIVVGLSTETTAAAVGSTPGAVRVAQHRALNRLRTVLTSQDRLNHGAKARIRSTGTSSKITGLVPQIMQSSYIK